MTVTELTDTCQSPIPSTWILNQPAPIGAKSPIFNRYLLISL